MSIMTKDHTAKNQRIFLLFRFDLLIRRCYALRLIYSFEKQFVSGCNLYNQLQNEKKTTISQTDQNIE